MFIAYLEPKVITVTDVSANKWNAEEELKVTPQEDSEAYAKFEGVYLVMEWNVLHIEYDRNYIVYIDYKTRRKDSEKKNMNDTFQLRKACSQDRHIEPFFLDVLAADQIPKH